MDVMEMAEENKGESQKAQKFRKLGEARLEKAVHSIKLIAPLADKSRYEYTDAQVKYILRTLKESVRNVESAFQGKVEKEISLP
jgi:hypothetical protein